MAVTQRLLLENNLEKVGGASYIAELPKYNSANISFYLSEVKKLWEKRELYSYLVEGQKALKDGADGKEITDNLNDALINLQIASDPTNGESSLEEILETFQKDCDRKRELNHPGFIGELRVFGIKADRHRIIALGKGTVARPQIGIIQRSLRLCLAGL